MPDIEQLRENMRKMKALADEVLEDYPTEDEEEEEEEEESSDMSDKGRRKALIIAISKRK